MSEHITHIAVYEDCSTMVLETARFCEAFRSCLKSHYDSGMLASGSRGNHLFAVPILESFREQKMDLEPGGEAGAKVAGALGWITHRAADLQMKPTWRSKETDDPDFPSPEMQIYHDAVTFREVYRGGRRSTGSAYELLTPHTLEPGMKSHPVAGMLNVETAEELLSFLFQSEFLSLHQYISSEDDIGTWMNNTIEYHQEFSEDLRMYTEAFTHPDQAKMQKYVTGINYYDPEDPLIRWVRKVQEGKKVSEDELDKAIDTVADQSQYAQALGKGYHFLLDASRYFSNEIEKDQLYDTLQISEVNRF